MFDQIKNALSSKQAQQLTDVRNIGLYIFGIVVLAIAWSGARTVQSNYELQKKIATLKQENTVLWLQNQNTYLQTQYYKTDQYLELSARQNLGLAAPGEQVLLVPKDVASRYVDPNLNKTSSVSETAVPDNRAGYIKNLEAWRDFLLGRKLTND
ncbi:septum formation initiator family protein [Candidatus Saccharibacteria bacterium]|nr:septum formation initiator family protein [Candidatus Saccharibacteria bacterium]